MNMLSRLKLLDNPESIREQILCFEKESGIDLPPIFKIFVETFDLENLSEKVSRIFFNEEDNIKHEIDSWEFKENPEIGIELFLKPNEYIGAKKNVYHYDEDIELVRNKIVVANIYGGTLLLSYGSNDSEHIYADFIGGTRMIKVANNIFEFFKGFEVSLNSTISNRLGLTERNLYKNWGEDFWRIRDN